MASLIITDIRKSGCDGDFDLITAIILSAESSDLSCVFPQANKSCNGLLILESAIAEKELTSIGVHKGDQFMRMWAKPYHGLQVGETISLGND